MINERNIQGYIGGSDSVRVHGSWETKTFVSFWRERLSGFRESNPFDTIHTAAGNIMESEILSAVGIDKKFWSVEFPAKETMAGCNTDAFDGRLHETKTVLSEEGMRWVIGYSIPATYMYQVMHNLFVTKAEEVLLHVCLMTPQEKINPFSIENVRERVHTFRFHKSYFDKTKVTMAMYGAFMEHLTDCYRRGVFPRDAEKQEILNLFHNQNS